MFSLLILIGSYVLTVNANNNIASVDVMLNKDRLTNIFSDFLTRDETFGFAYQDEDIGERQLSFDTSNARFQVKNIVNASATQLICDFGIKIDKATFRINYEIGNMFSEEEIDFEVNGVIEINISAIENFCGTANGPTQADTESMGKLTVNDINLNNGKAIVDIYMDTGYLSNNESQEVQDILGTLDQMGKETRIQSIVKNKEAASQFVKNGYFMPTILHVFSTDVVKMGAKDYDLVQSEILSNEYCISSTLNMEEHDGIDYAHFHFQLYVPNSSAQNGTPFRQVLQATSPLSAQEIFVIKVQNLAALQTMINSNVRNWIDILGFSLCCANDPADNFRQCYLQRKLNKQKFRSRTTNLCFRSATIEVADEPEITAQMKYAKQPKKGKRLKLRAKIEVQQFKLADATGFFSTLSGILGTGSWDVATSFHGLVGACRATDFFTALGNYYKEIIKDLEIKKFVTGAILQNQLKPQLTRNGLQWVAYWSELAIKNQLQSFGEYWKDLCFSISFPQDNQVSIALKTRG